MGGDGLSFRPRIDTMYRAKNEELIFVKVCVCDKSLECWLHGFSARQGVLARALQSVLESRHRILVLTMCDFGRFVYFSFFQCFPGQCVQQRHDSSWCLLAGRSSRRSSFSKVCMLVRFDN